MVEGGSVGEWGEGGVEEEETEALLHLSSDILRQRSGSWLIRTAVIEHGQEQKPIGLMAWTVLVLSYLSVVLAFPLSLLWCVKVVREYERVVVFRLGRLMEGQARGPGICFLLPCIDSIRVVDLRVVSFDVPPQEILSRDSVTVSVDAVVYFHISNPIVSVTRVSDAGFSTQLLAQTTLRNILGLRTLSEMLSQRDAIANTILHILDEGTDPWGVKVDRVEVKDIRLPHSLMKSMATEAEATRQAAARFTAAEGERRASYALQEAAQMISQSRTALHLRLLQTLVGISAQHNDTVIVPVSKGLLKNLHNVRKKLAGFLRRRHQQKLLEISQHPPLIQFDP